MAVNQQLKNAINQVKFKTNLKQAEIADKLGIKSTYLSDMINGRVPFTENISDKIYELFHIKVQQEQKVEVNTDIKFYGGGLTEPNIGKSVPLLPIEAVAGFPDSDVDGISYDECEQYTVPEFERSGYEFLIRVSGSSMYPKYSNGDILACKKICEILFFQWGKVYVIDSSQGALVKRVFPDKENPDNILLMSDNKDNYPPFSIPKSDIRSLSIVLGVIRME